MYCIVIDAHLSDGDQVVMHNVLPLRGVDIAPAAQNCSVAHLTTWPNVVWNQIRMVCFKNMDFSITHAIVDFGFSHADRRVFMQRILKLNDNLKLIFKPSSTQIQIIHTCTDSICCTGTWYFILLLIYDTM